MPGKRVKNWRKYRVRGLLTRRRDHVNAMHKGKRRR